MDVGFFSSTKIFVDLIIVGKAMQKIINETSGVHFFVSRGEVEQRDRHRCDS